MGGFSKLTSKLGGLGKIIQKVDPLRGGDVIAEKIGLPTLTGSGENNILDMGQTAAAEAADDAATAQKNAQDAMLQAQKDATDRATALAAQQAAQSAQLNEINKNYAADLGSENRTNIEAGGTASAVDASTDNLKKKQGVGLASTLGINV